MAWQLVVKDPALGKTGELALSGIGILKNGKTYEVSDEEAFLFEVATGVNLADANFYNISVTELSQDSKTEGGE